MWALEFENFRDSLSACDFSQAAIDVFRILRLTEEKAPLAMNGNALTFVYEHFSSDLVLTQKEGIHWR
jgi:hypothetical protein